MEKLPLTFTLPFGLHYQDKFENAVTLLRSDAVAEEVYTRKSPEKPYTYIADVIAVSVGSIGSVEIGSAVRDRYVKDGYVTVPDAVKHLSLADANTLLLEIHRRCWQRTLKNQRIVCSYCAKSINNATVDLGKVKMTDEQVAKLSQYQGQPVNICVDLEEGFDMRRFVDDINAKVKDASQHKFLDIRDLTFNRMIFRVPTLGDALLNESYASNRITFWRRIGADCLIALQAFDYITNTVIAEFPMEYKAWLGTRMYDFFEGVDLKKIRNGLIEEIPTMPFSYSDTCPCDQRKEIPFAMEASSFFSE